MTIKHYYNNLQTALREVELSIREMEVMVTDEYTSINYSKILTELNNFRRKIVLLLNVHKFMRLSRESFELKTMGNKKNIEVTHIVKDYETPLIIANKYNMSLDELLKKNNLKSYEITPGKEISVEINYTNNITKTYEDIPTFGSHEGDLLFGSDLPNKLEVDSRGDLRLLTPVETLSQGILNRALTKAGSYPLEADFGISIPENRLPSELVNVMHMLKVHLQLLLDKRIKDVKNLSSIKQGNKLSIKLQLKTVNNITVNV